MSEDFRIDFDSLDPSMTLHSVSNNLHSPPTTPSHHQNGQSPASTRLTPMVSNAYETPTRSARSPQLSNNMSPLLSENESPMMGQSRRLSNSDPIVESDNPWSSAVGGATLGKSGQVIERLQGKNDSLRRELNLARVKLEEELRHGESSSATLDSLRATNENLVAIHDADKAALARRDRKLEEAKAELAIEKSRREKAEAEAKSIGHERDETVKHYKKEALEAQERGGKAVVEQRIILQAWNSKDESYQRQIDQLNTTLKFLQRKRDEDLKLLAKRDVIIEELGESVKRTQKANDEIEALFNEYKAAKEENTAEITMKLRNAEKANEELAKEMAEVMGKMKHAIIVKRDVRGAE